MRSYKALSLFVCLAVSLRAEASSEQSWYALHKAGIAAVGKGDFEGAAVLLAKSKPLADTGAARAFSANDLGVVLHQLTRDEEARTNLEEAFRLWLPMPDARDHLAQTSEALSVVYRTLGDYPAAESILRQALKNPPADNENRALVLNQLGDVLRETGHSNEATALLEQSLAMPGTSPRRRLDATMSMADLDRDARRWDSSVSRWNQAIDAAREHQWLALEAASVRGLGATYMEQNDRARAEPLLRRALSMFEQSRAPRHQIASTLSCLAQLYLADKKLGLADEALIRASDIVEKELSPTHPQVAVLLEMRGQTAGERNRFEEARDFYGRARLIMASRFGERSAIAAAVDASWAVIEQKLKHNDDAAADFEKALAVLDVAGPEVESLRTLVHRQYAELCKSLHRKVPPTMTSMGTASALR